MAGRPPLDLPAGSRADTSTDVAQLRARAQQVGLIEVLVSKRSLLHLRRATHRTIAAREIPNSCCRAWPGRPPCRRRRATQWLEQASKHLALVGVTRVQSVLLR